MILIEMKMDVFEMIWGAAEGSDVSDCCYQRGGDKSSLPTQCSLPALNLPSDPI